VDVPEELTAWRLVKTRYAATAFDGDGARRYGGRWNSPGTRVAYASESAALAVLEVLVHLQASALLPSYSLASVRFPAALVAALGADELPSAWAEYPPPSAAQRVGDGWVREGRSAVLRVPSVVVEGAHNFLLDPAHPDSHQVRVQPVRPFTFDPRLLSHTP
jgi:RES domain-containing protein